MSAFQDDNLAVTFLKNTNWKRLKTSTSVILALNTSLAFKCVWAKRYFLCNKLHYANINDLLDTFWITMKDGIQQYSLYDRHNEHKRLLYTLGLPTMTYQKNILMTNPNIFTSNFTPRNPIQNNICQFRSLSMVYMNDWYKLNSHSWLSDYGYVWKDLCMMCL